MFLDGERGKSKFLMDDSGFTLIEVLVSLVIISLLTVFFLPLFTLSYMWIGMAGDKGTAADYAVSVLEYLYAYPGEIRENMALSDLKDADIKNPPGGMQAVLEVEKYGTGDSLFLTRIAVYRTEDMKKLTELSRVIAKK
ncbi:prepilin-type N-terminal cleavage/methylation domain-containing protein [Thermosyntropha sp.]|uniref:prepilin-type N-terminal cleavage/methylation domain-containing protein n=1 Tax=Thermosyntropha sp. TaxID=2740820 RepID=UPI0025DC1807|nr:prepilin-type N-terminal cleavage/methylation domain-containing protein [Thermosyntropha sp.]MBO8159237.1 prepilin-type N-terminal cleavage/methylation domain-containing protein [Thermosyntropha sp.]